MLGEIEVESNNQAQQIKAYPVWDRTTRWFHWVNVLCIIGLMAFGLMILNHRALGIEDEIVLKKLHVSIGYVFVLNLAWRLIWGFIGGKYSRWTRLLPLGRGYAGKVREYAAGLLRGKPPAYKGHNPLGRIMVTTLLLLLTLQAVTGLVIAGTDLYYPPFGGQIESWVAADTGSGKAELTPGSREGINEANYAEMRDFRKPFVEVHETVFYLILIAVLLHIAGVVVTEVVEKSGLVSAMFSGRKYFAEKPVDDD